MSLDDGVSMLWRLSVRTKEPKGDNDLHVGVLAQRFRSGAVGVQRR